MKFLRNLLFKLFNDTKYLFDFVKKLFVIFDENDDYVDNERNYSSNIYSLMQIVLICRILSNHIIITLMKFLIIILKKTKTFIFDIFVEEFEKFIIDKCFRVRVVNCCELIIVNAMFFAIIKIENNESFVEEYT